MPHRSPKPLRRSLVAALISFLLGAWVLACPMPNGPAVAASSGIDAKCAESHDHSGAERQATELCKARIGLAAATLTQDRKLESPPQSFDASTALDLFVIHGLQTERNIQAPYRLLIVRSTPRNLNFRVLRF